MYESAKEFAIKYAGRQVQITGSSPSTLIPNPLGRIIGYREPYITLELEGESWNASWECNINYIQQSLSFVVPIDSLRSEIKNIYRVWEVGQRYITILDVKPIVLYPSSCKFCKSVARKIGSIVFCSNSKCKTRNKFRKQYKSKVIKRVGMNCPTCGEPATTSSRGGAVSSGVYRLNCNQVHSWNYSPKKGDILKCSLYGVLRKGMFPDYVFDGNNFNKAL